MIKMRKMFVLCVVFVLCFTMTGFTFHWTEKAEKYHEIAEIMRSMGYDDSNEIITWCKEMWWNEYKAAEDEYYASVEEIESEPEQEVAQEEENEVVEDAKLETIEEEIPAYTDQDVDIVASVIYNEAAYDTTERHKLLVGCVVVNRKDNWQFPNTIYGVVTQRGQYLPAYAEYGSYYMSRAMNSGEWDYFRALAIMCLNYEVECPSNVLYQAEFYQGAGVYEMGYTSYSVTYFCYG